ncbi:hypothetical protein CYFUS_003675 [Cystobacter fuscus]|uniref:Uncharacterized protein n=1 Tax=Cystobacter fuscus TaxID=43 RepID=A0A250J404_9BACT|nr:hypothetical protein [Cystobacter fuscus]ATB38242.1 hypothetical protein CYFUS_003675 [Cystobacter fuscus]
MSGGWKKWLAVAAVAGTSPAALGATLVEPRLRVSLEERYDDDFRLNPVVAPDAPTGGALGTTPTGQLMSKVTPRVGLDVKDRTLKLESFYAADLLLRHGSGTVTLDHRAGLTVRKLLSRRLRVEASGSIFRVTDPRSLPRESVARTNQPVLYGASKLSVTHRVSRRVDVAAGYSFEGVRVLTAGSVAGFVHTPYLETWVRTAPQLWLGAEYRYQAFLYGDSMDQAHGLFGALRYRLSRNTTATLRGGPVSFLGEDGTRGWMPRVKLEVLHERGTFDMGFILGHDLVGASGFSNTLWADYAGLTFNKHFSPRAQLFAAASFFRNGRAPGEDAFRWNVGTNVSQGYTLSAGFEFKVNRYVSMQAAVDRIAQVGMGEAAADVNLSRNVAALRLHMTAW